MTDDRLEIDGVTIDTDKRIPFPLTFRIADVKKPEERKRNKSLTIDLPGTQINMNFFSSMYKLSLSEAEGSGLVGFSFDPTQRSEVKYWRGGILVFDGLCQLMRVTKKNGLFRFKITMFSNFVDLFARLADISIAELGWSEYDHDLTRANIINSFDTSVIVNGVPTSNFTAGNPEGFGYLYGMIDYGYSATLSTFKVTDLTPSVYWREVVEKCLAYADMTFTSDFFDTELFKRKTVNFPGGERIEIGAAEVAARSSELDAGYSVSNDVVYSSFGTGPVYTHSSETVMKTANITGPTVTQGSYNAFDLATGIYTVPQTGNYDLTFSGSFDLGFGFTPPATVSVGANSAWYRFQIRRNGAVIAEDAYFVTSSQTQAVNANIQAQLNQGDQIDFVIVEDFVVGLPGFVGNVADIPVLNLSVTDNGGFNADVASIDLPLSDGDTVQISRFLPDMKAKDFISDVIKAFNLYFTDADENGNIEIEPLNDFYSPTSEFDDWTNKMDHSKEAEIEPAANLVEGKRYLFKWAEDNDYYNVQHREVYGVGYGDHVYTVPSTFKDGEKVYQMNFAQSVPVQVPNGLIMPRIISVEEGTGLVKPFKGKPRFSIYNGLVAGNWRLENDADPTQFDDLTSYPQMNHLRDLDNAEFDFNFGTPPIVYWAASSYTTNNLFKFHEKFLRELTGRDSKFLTAYFQLRATDVVKPFGRLVMINGSLFRKNSIIEFDDAANKTTKCELVRVLEGDSPKITTIGESQVPQIPGGSLGPVQSGGGTIGEGGSGVEVGLETGGGNQVNETSGLVSTL